MIVKSDGDQTVYSDEEHNQADIGTIAEETVEKIKLENDLYDDSLTIRGRYLDIINTSVTSDDDNDINLLHRDDETPVNNSILTDAQQANDTLAKLYDKTGYNITMIVVNNFTIFKNLKTSQHSAIISYHYLFLVFLLLILVILLPSKLPACKKCAKSSKIYPHRSSPLLYKVTDNVEINQNFPKPYFSRKLIGKYLLIGSKTENIDVNIESGNNDTEEDITEINI